MDRSRFRKSGITFCVLLPYLLLAVGSGFLHTDGVATDTRQAGVVSAGSHGIALASAHLAHHDDCAVCGWSQSSTSELHVSFAFSPVGTATRFDAAEHNPLTTGGTRPYSSRAPPVS